MTPAQRAESMKELDKLNSDIADTEYELECEADDDGSAEYCYLESSLSRLKTERDRIMARFPEVRYWPLRFANN